MLWTDEEEEMTQCGVGGGRVSEGEEGMVVDE